MTRDEAEVELAGLLLERRRLARFNLQPSPKIVQRIRTLELALYGVAQMSRRGVVKRYMELPSPEDTVAGWQEPHKARTLPMSELAPFLREIERARNELQTDQLGRYRTASTEEVRNAATHTLRALHDRLEDAGDPRHEILAAYHSPDAQTNRQNFVVKGRLALANAADKEGNYYQAVPGYTYRAEDNPVVRSVTGPFQTNHRVRLYWAPNGNDNPGFDGVFHPHDARRIISGLPEEVATKLLAHLDAHQSPDRMTRRCVVSRYGRLTLSAPRKRTLMSGSVVHAHDLIDEAGANVGHVEIIPRNDGRHLHVQHVGSGDNKTPNVLGPEAMRSALSSLRDHYPDAEFVSGLRTSGFRKRGSTLGPGEIDVNRPQERTVVALPAKRQLSRRAVVHYAKAKPPEPLGGWPVHTPSDLISHAGAVFDDPMSNERMLAFADHLMERHPDDPHAQAFMRWITGESPWSAVTNTFIGSPYHPRGGNGQYGAPDQPYIELHPRYTTLGTGGATPRTVNDPDTPIGILSKRVDQPRWRFYQPLTGRNRMGTYPPGAAREGTYGPRDRPTPGYSHADMTSTEVAQHLYDTDGVRGLSLAMIGARHFHPTNQEGSREVKFSRRTLRPVRYTALTGGESSLSSQGPRYDADGFLLRDPSVETVGQPHYMTSDPRVKVHVLAPATGGGYHHMTHAILRVPSGKHIWFKEDWLGRYPSVEDYYKGGARQYQPKVLDHNESGHPLTPHELWAYDLPGGVAPDAKRDELHEDEHGNPVSLPEDFDPYLMSRRRPRRYGADHHDVAALLGQLQQPEHGPHMAGLDDPLSGLRGITADALDEQGRGEEAQLLRTPGTHIEVRADGTVKPSFMERQGISRRYGGPETSEQFVKPTHYFETDPGNEHHSFTYWFARHTPVDGWFWSADDGEGLHPNDVESGHPRYQEYQQAEDLGGDTAHLLSPSELAYMHHHATTPEFKLSRRGQPVRKSLVNRHDFLGALRRVASSNHSDFVKRAVDVAKKMGMAHTKALPALHDTPSGSVPGVAQAVYGESPPDRVAALAAWVNGLLPNGPGYSVFHMRPQGPDTLYRFRHDGSGMDVRSKLDRAGITSRVMVPHRRGFDVLVPDIGNKLQKNVEAYAQQHGLQVEASPGYFKTAGSATDQGQSRDTFRTTVAAQEAKDGVTQMRRGKPKRYGAETTEEDFHRLLDANPEDHHTRLVFADWLQDRGDPRAEGYRALGTSRVKPNAPSGRERHRYPFGWTHSLNTHRQGLYYPDSSLPHDWWSMIRSEGGHPAGQNNPFWKETWNNRRGAEDAAAHAFAGLPGERKTEILRPAQYARKKGHVWFKLIDAARSALKKVNTGPDYQRLFWHGGTKTAHWMSADGDDEKHVKTIHRALKVPGVKQVVGESEAFPKGKGWVEIPVKRRKVKAGAKKYALGEGVEFAPNESVRELTDFEVPVHHFGTGGVHAVAYIPRIEPGHPVKGKWYWKPHRTLGTFPSVRHFKAKYPHGVSEDEFLKDTAKRGTRGGFPVHLTPHEVWLVTDGAEGEAPQAQEQPDYRPEGVIPEDFYSMTRRSVVTKYAKAPQSERGQLTPEQLQIADTAHTTGDRTGWGALGDHLAENGYPNAGAVLSQVPTEGRVSHTSHLMDRGTYPREDNTFLYSFVRDGTNVVHLLRLNANGTHHTFHWTISPRRAAPTQMSRRRLVKCP